ncbi:hypothetical protein ANTQUA_LOCUS484 [Anthophora quadrimaculata]
MPLEKARQRWKREEKEERKGKAESKARNINRSKKEKRRDLERRIAFMKGRKITGHPDKRHDTLCSRCKRVQTNKLSEYGESEARSRHRNHREFVQGKSRELSSVFYNTNVATIMTFKRRAADCTTTGITFPNRLIYLALS